MGMCLCALVLSWVIICLFNIHLPYCIALLVSLHMLFPFIYTFYTFFNYIHTFHHHLSPHLIYTV